MRLDVSLQRKIEIYGILFFSLPQFPATATGPRNESRLLACGKLR